MSKAQDPTLPSTIFVLSDSTGGTAEAMTRAALAQFEDYLVNISTYTHIADPRRVEALTRLAAKQNALIVFTLVNPEIREAIYEAGNKHRVECVDLMGQLIGSVSKQLGGMQPRGIPGRKTMLSDEYFRRVDAVEFTVKHDDGAEPRYLHKSDIVLIGVSRTSKTPLSTYLAQKGYKVANIPIVLGIDLPPELFEVNQDKIFALTIEPEPLHAIRLARIRNLGLKSSSNYGSIEHIYMELDYANELFRANPRWPVIDVTRRAVEESATVILETIQARRQERSNATTIRG
ncbi:MAG: transcriptional regulator [Rickettsiales bacterium]|nr:transcriptional regulator [Rickettsiales bacterium]|tara:strand:+ start:1344 stop:2210 length:867 start_codon:yes stop_codon:yes gene_type:complete